MPNPEGSVKTTILMLPRTAPCRHAPLPIRKSNSFMLMDISVTSLSLALLLTVSVLSVTFPFTTGILWRHIPMSIETARNSLSHCEQKAFSSILNTHCLSPFSNTAISRRLPFLSSTKNTNSPLILAPIFCSIC